MAMLGSLHFRWSIYVDLEFVSMTSTHFCARAHEIQSARTVVSTIGIHYCRPNFPNCACSFLCNVISKDMLLLQFPKYGSDRFLTNVEHVYWTTSQETVIFAALSAQRQNLLYTPRRKSLPQFINLIWPNQNFFDNKIDAKRNIVAPHTGTE
jgi:hypothetical protein